MAIVYKYTDTSDNIIKYIGIVWSENKTLSDRIKEHFKEKKFQNIKWKVEYFECENRSIAEAWESHLISKYNTNNYLNICKKDWGYNPYIPNDEDLWINYENNPVVMLCNEYDVSNIFIKHENNWYIDTELLFKISDNKMPIKLVVDKQNNTISFISMTDSDKRDKFSFIRSELVPINELIKIDNHYYIKNIKCKDIFEKYSEEDAYEYCFNNNIPLEVEIY